MSRLDELIEELCPDGVEYKSLCELANIQRGVRVVRKQLSTEGKYPVYQNSLTPLGYHTVKNCEAGTTFVICAGAAGDVGYSNVDFWAADDCHYIKGTEKLLSRYLFHVLLWQQTYLYSQVRRGSIPRLSRTVLEKIKIPVPPLPVQQEIVRILDSFTELTAELTAELIAELTARKKQYEYYSSEQFPSIKESNYDWVELGSIATVTKLAGFEFTKYVVYSETGNVIALRGLNVKNGHLVLDDVKYIDNSDLTMLSRSKLHIGDMLFTYVGTVGQVALIDKNDKYYLAPNVALVRINDKKYLPKYMMYYFLTNKFKEEQIAKLLQASSMQNIPMEKIRKFKLPVITLEEQQRIVSILDQFDMLYNGINNGLPKEIAIRQKQYEYYRDKLLTFPKAEVVQ